MHEQLINHFVIPHTTRTIGSEKALVSVQERESSLHITLSFGFPAQHLAQELQQQIAAATGKSVELNIRQNIVAHKVQAGIATMKGVKNIIAVASGKGGVGKSTTTANLATAIAKMGARVGVLDADLYGPSQPTMLGVPSQQPKQENGKFIPVRNADDIQVMSIGFLIDPDQAVVWRGPMVSQALQQLLFQSEWDDVDYLFVDLPPGTGDIQLTLSQKIPVTGAVVVTTPQDIALIDARKAVDMFQKVNIPIMGVLENMSLHVCSNCGFHEPIFGTEGGKDLASKLNVPLLGQLPLSLPIRVAMDAGQAGSLHEQHDTIAAIYQQAALDIALTIADKGRDFSGKFPKIVVQ
ncbi:iron-sulfur cluster carrier protein ApbC [Kingella kingae]|uniref:iron-sulfur cluster carrier protein ApbC n=1 Tax=Kingella kingae TaxID=504 RepID=UPI00254EAE3B|nr:iron-sulfur cluster carrier protein ApbC [Kingella kingae]MDK4527845.1 iron-sulfur cluster carrier protein ApbC [Kingella kingae]MDK4542435.1 iron-sulfur cluster carrier protein ApbC [Kingella kingae]MDK4561991.1 iron-sulfur cluster carrier protein ApbC [Kingella kingae]MDK4597974.1 iron-sulfur cluster carrier protein ApbC [Kingella kingae]MDK4602182.1 iron-sulfur cluster carrier protein ApbC [Kingella kingae]